MELQIFENREFGKIRTTVDDSGRILFCGSDVAKALAYTNPPKALRDHCKGITKRSTLTSGGNQYLSFIPEPDVYRLIFRSKLPAAEKFEQWVVEIVLPTIRKHGAYITPDKLEQLMTNPTSVAKLFHDLKQLETKITDMQPKAEYYNALVETNVLTNIRQTAKELHIPEKLFTYLLLEMGFAYRTPKRLLMPYAFMVTSGFAELKEYTNGKHGGVYMLFTPVGRLFLSRKICQRLAMKPSTEPVQSEQEQKNPNKEH